MKKLSALLLALCLMLSITAMAENQPAQTDAKLRIFTLIFSDSTSFGYTDCNDRPIAQFINEASGIDVVWDTLAAGANAIQVMNTMIASGTIKDYDIVISSDIFTGASANQYLSDEIIRPLNDYMDQLPNYTRYFEDIPALEKKSRAQDGTYYALYCMRESGWANTYQGPLIRQDWLDALGLPMPATFEDWDTVLRAFNEAYGAKLTSIMSIFRFYGICGSFNAYGTFSRVTYIDDEGKVQLGQVQPEWKEFMKALNTWYEDGLIDPDLLTNDYAAVRTKALKEETGFVVINLGSIDPLNNEAKEAGLNSRWVGCPYPVNSEGVVPWMQGNPDVTAEAYNAVITTGCDDAELPTALAWLNWAYSDEGFITFNYGKEGVSFEMVDGVPVYADSVLNSDESLDSAMKRISGTVGQYWPIQAEGLVRAKNSAAACAAVDVWLLNSEVEKHKVPNVTLTQEESAEITDIDSALATYVSEQALKFFTSERSLDEFDAFVEELNRIGLERYLEIYQNAVDRYNAS